MGQSLPRCRVKARSYHELLHFYFDYPPSKPQRSIPGFLYVLPDQYHEFRLTFIYIVLRFITQCGSLLTICSSLRGGYFKPFARFCKILHNLAQSFQRCIFHPRFDSIDQSKHIPLCMVIWPRSSRVSTPLTR